MSKEEESLLSLSSIGSVESQRHYKNITIVQKDQQPILTESGVEVIPIQGSNLGLDVKKLAEFFQAVDDETSGKVKSLVDLFSLDLKEAIKFLETLELESPRIESLTDFSLFLQEAIASLETYGDQLKIESPVEMTMMLKELVVIIEPHVENVNQPLIETKKIGTSLFVDLKEAVQFIVSEDNQNSGQITFNSIMGLLIEEAVKIIETEDNQNSQMIKSLSSFVLELKEAVQFIETEDNQNSGQITFNSDMSLLVKNLLVILRDQIENQNSSRINTSSVNMLLDLRQAFLELSVNDNENSQRVKTPTASGTLHNKLSLVILEAISEEINSAKVKHQSASGTLDLRNLLVIISPLVEDENTGRVKYSSAQTLNLLEALALFEEHNETGYRLSYESASFGLFLKHVFQFSDVDEDDNQSSVYSDAQGTLSLLEMILESEFFDDVNSPLVISEDVDFELSITEHFITSGKSYRTGNKYRNRRSYRGWLSGVCYEIPEGNELGCNFTKSGYEAPKGDELEVNFICDNDPPIDNISAINRMVKNSNFDGMDGFIELSGGAEPYSLEVVGMSPDGISIILDGNKIYADGVTSEIDGAYYVDVKVISNDEQELELSVGIFIGEVKASTLFNVQKSPLFRPTWLKIKALEDEE